MPANPEGLLPVEQREAIARIIDPKAWVDFDRLTAPLQPHEAGREDKLDGWLKRANDGVSPSLAKADEILARFEQSLARPGMEEMREALEQIEAWELPSTGEFWPSGDPISYEAAYGSNGARDYIRNIARAALSQVPSQEGK